MSVKTRILAIGRNKEISSVLLRLINNNPDWEGLLAETDEEAITLFNQNDFDLVLFGSGVDEESEEKLRGYFLSKKPSIIILQHYGGGSGLLKNEIYEALASRK